MPVFLHFDSNPPADKIKNGSMNLNLNKLMQNVGAEQFDFGTFKAAYDTDPRIKTMIKNFDKDGIEPKTKNTREDEPPVTNTDDAQSATSVAQMAKRATDLSNDL